MSNRFNDLIAFVLPLSTCGFLISGQHGIVSALLWTLPFWLMLLIDWLNPRLPYEASEKSSQVYYDGVLYGLALLQFANLGLMASYVSQLSWTSSNNLLTNLVNLLVIRFLVGTSSGTSGIVLAHELIHRPQSYLQLLGRLLLCTVGYDHFVIAHMRGHHADLGLPDDIATARIGESFKDYWQRVYLGYWRYAWQSEEQRLAENPVQTVRLYALKGTEPVAGLHQRLITLWHNQVLQGMMLEAGLLLLILIVYGGLAAIMLIYQAWAAVRILEAVNYFQHWGLGQGEFGNSYGWVSRSWLSRYALLGLSHHIGHHEDENRHYHAIAYSDIGPQLPYGYFVMNLWVKLDNAAYQKMALGELIRFRDSQTRPISTRKKPVLID